MSGASLFLIWLIGLLIELDVFHAKKNIPLVKSNHIGPHIIFWVVLLIVSFIAFGVFYSATSPDFKLAMEKADASKTDTNKTIDTINDQTEALSESADMKNEENTSAPESLPETESANEETDNSTTSKLIEDKTYYFDDAMFTINGIQLTVNSITLHREYKPEGYSLEVAYSKAEVGISIRLDFLFHIHQMLCCRCPFRALIISPAIILRQTLPKHCTML